MPLIITKHKEPIQDDTIFVNALSVVTAVGQVIYLRVNSLLSIKRAHIHFKNVMANINQYSHKFTKSTNSVNFQICDKSHRFQCVPALNSILV